MADTKAAAKKPTKPKEAEASEPAKAASKARRMLDGSIVMDQKEFKAARKKLSEDA